MNRLWRRLVEWKTRNFLATFPPFLTKTDGGSWIIAKFAQQNGRLFNPFSSHDRYIVRTGVSRAMAEALPVLFTGSHQTSGDAKEE